MHHSATYSPEDNKLRLYPAHRLDKETYERVKAAGFSWELHAHSVLKVYSAVLDGTA